MAIALGVVMDPIAGIKIAKDSSFAMLLEAQRRGYALWYMEQGELFLRDGQSFARMRELQVSDDPAGWYRFGAERVAPLAALDVILMRKDPPFDMEYVYTTYLLERAEQAGVLLVNKPQSLRDANEKLFTAWFAECAPPTLVSRSAAQIRDFLAEHGDIILKPLEGMGGSSVFRLRQGDNNIAVTIELLTRYGAQFVMAQRFIPEITAGDRRILMIDGEPIPYALARMPAAGEVRANLAAGGTGVGVELSERERWICAQVGPALRERGLLFVGLDVIGDYLTEINVTSPTCIRELDRQFGLNIAGTLMQAIERKLAAGRAA